MKKALLIIALCFSQAAYAAPKIKIPPLKMCANRAGEIFARQKCASGETIFNTGVLSALASVGPQGPQGAVGPQGPGGTFSWQKCTKRTASSSDDGYVITSLYCDPGEFLVTHGFQSAEFGATDLVSLIFNSTDKIAVGVLYGVYRPFDIGGFNTVTVTGVCCLP